MEYSTTRIERELNALGMEYAKGSVYDRFCQLTDLRSVHGKRYELEGVLTIIVFAKLCGEDKPTGIAEWQSIGKENESSCWVCARRGMPHHNTYRRILAHKVYEQEVARLVGNITRVYCLPTSTPRAVYSHRTPLPDLGMLGSWAAEEVGDGRNSGWWIAAN